MATNPIRKLTWLNTIIILLIKKSDRNFQSISTKYVIFDDEYDRLIMHKISEIAISFG